MTYNMYDVWISFSDMSWAFQKGEARLMQIALNALLHRRCGLIKIVAANAYILAEIGRLSVW